MNLRGVLLAALFAAVAAVGLVMLFFVATDADARPDHCGNVHSIEDSANGVTYDASPGVVAGVCIKSGVNMWDGDHSPLFGNGVVYNDDQEACYSIAGVHTSVVTVTRLGEGRYCQGISHIDVDVTQRTPTPTPTATPTPTPTVTPTPFVTPTPTPTPFVTPTPTPTPCTDCVPTPTPPMVGPTPTPAGGTAGAPAPVGTDTVQAPAPAGFPVTGGAPACEDGGGFPLNVNGLVMVAFFGLGIGGLAGATLASGGRK